jgi:hypothetical protein
MAANEAHQFDRRITDANVASLSIRVSSLERRVEVVESDLKDNTRELQTNTALTRQVHTMAEAVKQDTADIVSATKWLSTTKKLALVAVGAVSVTCGAIVAAVHALKALGLL